MPLGTFQSPRRATHLVTATALALATLVGPTAIAEVTAAPAEVRSERVAVDRELCDWMADVILERAETHPSDYTIEQRRAMSQKAECFGLITESFEPDTTAFNVQTAAAATYCGYKNASYSLYIWGWDAAQAKMYTHMCWDRVDDVWNNNYASCYVSTAPGFLTGEDYCDTYNEYTTRATNRFDYSIAAFSAPWYWRYGTMYYYVNYLGTQSATYGSLR